MDNLAILALLVCPLMMGALFYFILRGTKTNEHVQGRDSQTESLKENMNKLMKQNEQLIEEINRMKRNR